MGLVAMGCDTRSSAPLPVLSRLPEFRLTRHDGQAFGRTDLNGKTSVFSFVFTRCPTICPLITTRTKTLQNRLRASDKPSRFPVQLLSISVDPDFDSTEVLQKFRRRWNIDPQGKPRWFHLTGDSTVIQELVVKGFRTALGDPSSGEMSETEKFDILHSSHFVLVDHSAQIRGYFRGDEEGMGALIDALNRLATSSRSLPSPASDLPERQRDQSRQ